MTHDPTAAETPIRPVRLTSFFTYVAVVLTIARVIFPPFTSLSGTEYAFIFTGPEWSRAMGAFGEELGLTARIHWAALAVQLGALWAVALGAAWFVDGVRSPRKRSL